MITAEFAPLFLKTINEMHENPVHLLFNQWWSRATPEVVQAYRDLLLADPDFSAFVEAAHFAAPLDLDALSDLPEDTLGSIYRRWIVDNGLTAQIAMDYRGFHTTLVEAGQLDGMPPELQYAVLRGFQLHDFLHVLTGYDPSPQGEIALQAFSLAQLQFPYFAMWMSTTTTQMTYLRPTSIVPLWTPSPTAGSTAAAPASCRCTAGRTSSSARWPRSGPSGASSPRPSWTSSGPAGAPASPDEPSHRRARAH